MVKEICHERGIIDSYGCYFDIYSGYPITNIFSFQSKNCSSFKRGCEIEVVEAGGFPIIMLYSLHTESFPPSYHAEFLYPYMLHSICSTLSSQYHTA